MTDHSPEPIDVQTPRYDEPQPKNSGRFMFAGFALLIGVGLGGAAGFYARSGEIERTQEVVSALEDDVSKARKHLRVANDDLESAQDDLGDANDRASEAEQTLERCATFAEVQVENVLGLLDAMELIMDDDYYSAIEMMDSLNPPSATDRDICTLDGEGDGAGI